jgi:hypothetical protein
MERLVDTPLICSLGAAALHDKHDLSGDRRVPCRFGDRIWWYVFE